MGNYTQLTQFTPKDALAPGNPLKTIFGALFDPEFSAISTAIASKANTNANATFASITATAASSLFNVSVTGAVIPSNGINLAAGNTLGFATNSSQVAYFGAVGGLVVGSPTGADLGYGTINSSVGVFINALPLGAQVGNASTTVTSRSSTTTISADPTLQVVLGSAGTYEFYLSFTGFVGGANGINFNINYSGSIANGALGSQYSVATSTGANPINAVYTLVPAASTLTFSTAQVAPGFVIRGTLIASTGGTLSLGWGPNSSNASATTVGNGILRVNKIA